MGYTTFSDTPKWGQLFGAVEGTGNPGQCRIKFLAIDWWFQLLAGRFLMSAMAVETLDCRLLHHFSQLQGCFLPIGSMYGIYANIWGILMVNVTNIYSMHGSYGLWCPSWILYLADQRYSHRVSPLIFSGSQKSSWRPWKRFGFALEILGVPPCPTIGKW